MQYDLVDSQDCFVKVGTKEETKKMRLFTRSVHIWLFNKKGDILICKRPANKKTYPNLITSSAGGHVEQGESYKVAATRELKEELDIITPLKDIGRFDVINKLERAIHHLFIGKLNKKITADLNEISSYDFLSFKAVSKNIASHPRKYCKPFHEAFKCYLEHIRN